MKQKVVNSISQILSKIRAKFNNKKNENLPPSNEEDLKKTNQKYQPFSIGQYNSLLEALIKTFTVSSAFGVIIVHSYLKDIGFGDLFPMAISFSGTLLATIFSMGMFGTGMLLLLYLPAGIHLSLKGTSQSLQQSPMLTRRAVTLWLVLFQVLILFMLTLQQITKHEVMSMAGILAIALAITVIGAEILYFLNKDHQNWKMGQTGIGSGIVLLVTMLFSITPWILFDSTMNSIPFFIEEKGELFGISLPIEIRQACFMIYWISIFTATTAFIIGDKNVKNDKEKRLEEIQFSTFTTILVLFTFSMVTNPKFFQDKVIQLGELADKPNTYVMVQMSGKDYAKLHDASNQNTPAIKSKNNLVCVNRAFRMDKKIVLCPKGSGAPNALSCALFSEDEFSYVKNQNIKCNEKGVEGKKS